MSEDSLMQSNDVLLKIGKLFRRMHAIASELRESISSAYPKTKPTERIGEFQTTLFKGEILPVVKEVSNIVESLNCPPSIAMIEEPHLTLERRTNLKFCRLPTWTSNSGFGLT